MNSNRHSGFTIVEVLVATVVFLLGVQAVFLGYGVVQDVRNEALLTRRASIIAEHVMMRLHGLGDPECISTTPAYITRDIVNDNNQRCFGDDIANISGQVNARCDPDHPQNAAGLSRVIGSQIDGGAGTHQIYVHGNAGNQDFDNLQVQFLGDPYRVVWNVHCDGSDSKHINVMVGWRPVDTAVRDRRFVELSFQPSVGSY